MGISFLPVMEYLARRAFLAAGLCSQTATFPCEAGGTRTIHYWAPPGEPRLPPLLLIHGFGPMATWQWRRQVVPFSRRYHVVVPDLLCFGGSSPCPSSPPPSESGQAAALAALLDALPGLAKTTRVAVVGTSYGGFVAYALARALGPGRVGPVVISNSDLLKTAEDDRALLQRAGGEWASTADLLMPLDARTARRLMELTFYRRQLTAMLPDFVIGETVRVTNPLLHLHYLIDDQYVPVLSGDLVDLQKLFRDKREEKIELMKAITVGTDEFQVTPLEQDVLLIWGDHDQIFPLDKAFAVKRCLGENVRLEIFKETGHVPQMEDPNRFNEVVFDFLLASLKSPNQHDQ